MTMHWAAQYIGRPWVSGGVGPNEFDCWGFVRHIKRVHEGIDLPIIAVDATSPRAVAKAFREHPELQRYEIHDKEPIPGDVVLMKHSKHPTHCGVWIDANGGGVLHCAQGMGVVFQKLHSLHAAGWAGVLFYRLKSEFQGS